MAPRLGVGNLTPDPAQKCLWLMLLLVIRTIHTFAEVVLAQTSATHHQIGNQLPQPPAGLSPAQ
eukprot:4852784-Amphidinium_carterae.1